MIQCFKKWFFWLFVLQKGNLSYLSKIEKKNSLFTALQKTGHRVVPPYMQHTVLVILSLSPLRCHDFSVFVYHSAQFSPYFFFSLCSLVTIFPTWNVSNYTFKLMMLECVRFIYSISGSYWALLLSCVCNPLVSITGPPLLPLIWQSLSWSTKTGTEMVTCRANSMNP